MSSRQSIVLQWLRSRLPVSQEELQRRGDFIDAFAFPAELKEQFAGEHPQWDYRQCESVWKGLKEYFHVCRLAGTSFVAMPSTAVDEAWHEFILWTREYDYFCQHAFGRFLHHTPAARAGGTAMNDGYWRAWRLACVHNNLSPHTTVTLPPLFALDADLGLVPVPNPKELARGYRGSTALTSSCGTTTHGSSGCGSSSGSGHNFTGDNQPSSATDATDAHGHNSHAHGHGDSHGHGNHQSHGWLGFGGHSADSPGDGHSGHGHGGHDGGASGHGSGGSSDSGSSSDSGGGSSDSGGGSSCGGASSCGGGGSSCGGGGGCGGSS